MSPVRTTVWKGEINVQLCVEESLLIGGEQQQLVSNQPLLNLRFPRDTFLPLYLLTILSQLQLYLKDDIHQIISHCWFSYNEKVLPWFLPIGVIYDMTMTKDIISRSNDTNGSTSRSIINVWPIKLHYKQKEETDRKLPHGFIPLITGEEQLEAFWMHRWKQACFIMNGSSKLMMQLTRQESVSFWSSIKQRDLDRFNSISSKIIPASESGFRMVPIKFHLPFNIETNKFDSPIQPVVKLIRDNNTSNPVIIYDIMIKEFPDLIDIYGNLKGSLIAQGIVIQPSDLIYELYTSLLSIDGFLHIIIRNP